MNDKYLLSLWSKAVLASKGAFCYNPECGNAAHSCHHILRVKHRMTRYDVRNGIPLCAECHRKAQRSIGWDIDLIPQRDKEWLREMANVNVKDFLVEHGMTRNELDKIQADMLKSIIAEAE
jgi:hypothetical protein